MTGNTPAVGKEYTLEITDAGRVGLADRIGPGVLKIEGTIVRQTDEGYMVSVSSVESLAGGSGHWSGEQVPVRQEYVRSLQQREFSPGRTAVAIGAAAVALGAFIATRSLVGSGAPVVTGGGTTGGGT